MTNNNALVSQKRYTRNTSRLGKFISVLNTPLYLNCCSLLFLIAPPKFTVPKDKMARNLIAVPVGNSIKLDCSATGYPRPTVRWYKDGALIRKGGPILYLSKFTTVLVMRDVVPFDTGKYSCNVSNPYGWISHSYSVDIHGRNDFCVASMISRYHVAFRSPWSMSF